MRFPVVLLALLSCVSAKETHWAYVPPVKAEVAGHPVDALLAKAWEQAKLKPAKLAAPRSR
jgi:hypothetical protein